MSSETSFCVKCKKHTTWETAKSGKKVVCVGCRGFFPCQTNCSHVDCRFERGEMWACDCSFYRENEEKCGKCGKAKS